MGLPNFYMSEKWKHTEISKDFLADLNKYVKYTEKDYKKLGATIKFTASKGDIEIMALSDRKSMFGPLYDQTIFKLYGHIGRTDVCNPLCKKHVINIFAIYLLLEKYGYLNKKAVTNTNFIDWIRYFGNDIIQDAQAELMSLQLI